MATPAPIKTTLTPMRIGNFLQFKEVVVGRGGEEGGLTMELEPTNEEEEEEEEEGRGRREGHE